MEPEERFGEPSTSLRRELPERSSLADELLDEILPERFEWRRMVRRYPLPALVIAALAGYWLGNRRGKALVTAVTGYATETVDRRLEQILNSDSD